MDLLDRLLEKGVGLSGDVVLSVAGIDLVWLGLRAVLKGLDGPVGAPELTPRRTGVKPAPARWAAPPAPATGRRAGSAAEDGDRRRSGRRVAPERRLGLDQADLDRGLVQLVMTVVELVRQVMERQALRRVDGGSLSDEQVEQLGLALLRLEVRMDDLKEAFGLTDDDLRLAVAAAEL